MLKPYCAMATIFIFIIRRFTASRNITLARKKSVVDQFLLLGFGTSGSSLKESYTISLQGEETLDGHKVVRLDLLPKTDEVRKQLSKIQLWLDESTWLPVQQQFFETGS